MKSTESREEFEKFVTEAGAVVAEFKPIDAVRLFLDFYQQERAEDCLLESEGDMLLCQWSIQGQFFVFNLTRQFVPALAPVQHKSQLSLTCSVSPTPALEALKPGAKWCGSPDDLPAFEYFIGKCPAFLAIGKLKPDNVTLTYAMV